MGRKAKQKINKKIRMKPNNLRNQTDQQHPQTTPTEEYTFFAFCKIYY